MNMLRCCPFCGGQAFLESRTYEDKDSEWLTFCSVCGVHPRVVRYARWPKDEGILPDEEEARLRAVRLWNGEGVQYKLMGRVLKAGGDADFRQIEFESIVIYTAADYEKVRTEGISALLKKRGENAIIGASLWQKGKHDYFPVRIYETI